MTWIRSSPHRFNVEYTWCVCREKPLKATLVKKNLKNWGLSISTKEHGWVDCVCFVYFFQLSNHYTFIPLNTLKFFFPYVINEWSKPCPNTGTSSSCNIFCSETMRKLCLATKFPHQGIRLNYGTFRSVTWFGKIYSVCSCSALAVQILGNWVIIKALLKHTWLFINIHARTIGVHDTFCIKSRM